MSTTTTLIPTDWVCMTCGQHLNAAYRRYDADGSVLEGCISAAHNGYADAWHNRAEAIAFRGDDVPVPDTGVIAAVKGTVAWFEHRARIDAIFAELDAVKAERTKARMAA